MFHFLTKKPFLIALAIISLGLLIFSFFITPPTPLPTLLATIPSDYATKVSYLEPIQLKFATAVDPNLLSVTSIPEESWDITSAPNNIVKLQSKKYLFVNTEYTLNIFYNNQPLKTLTFTTIPQQSEPRANQEVVDEIKRDYPLANKIPYEASGFTILYKSPKHLEITLKVGVEERGEIINAVRDWVKENGLDPDSHTYTFSN